MAIKVTCPQSFVTTYQGINMEIENGYIAELVDSNDFMQLYMSKKDPRSDATLNPANYIYVHKHNKSIFIHEGTLEAFGFFIKIARPQKNDIIKIKFTNNIEGFFTNLDTILNTMQEAALEDDTDDYKEPIDILLHVKSGCLQALRTCEKIIAQS